MLLCGAHVAFSSPGSGPVTTQPSAVATQSTVAHDSVAQWHVHDVDHDHSVGASDADGATEPHPHRGEPTCHQDGTHDQAGQANRILERHEPVGVAVVLSIDPGRDVEPALRPPPDGTHHTAPTRRDCGRRHLVLAQISRT